MEETNASHHNEAKAIGFMSTVAFLYLATWWAYSHAQKEEVRERQDYTCADCGDRNPDNFEVHHIRPQCKKGTDTLDNAIGLCGPKGNDCHEKWDKLALEQGILWGGETIEVGWFQQVKRHINKHRRHRRRR